MINVGGRWRFSFWLFQILFHFLLLLPSFPFFSLSLALFVPGNKRRREGKGEEEEEEEVNALICMRVVSSAVGK